LMGPVQATRTRPALPGRLMLRDLWARARSAAPGSGTRANELAAVARGIVPSSAPPRGFRLTIRRRELVRGPRPPPAAAFVDAARPNMRGTARPRSTRRIWRPGQRAPPASGGLRDVAFGDAQHGPRCAGLPGAAAIARLRDGRRSAKARHRGASCPRSRARDAGRAVDPRWPSCARIGRRRLHDETANRWQGEPARGMLAQGAASTAHVRGGVDRLHEGGTRRLSRGGTACTRGGRRQRSARPSGASRDRRVADCSARDAGRLAGYEGTRGVATSSTWSCPPRSEAFAGFPRGARAGRVSAESRAAYLLLLNEGGRAG